MHTTSDWPEGVPEDLAYQRRSWKFQRCARVMMGFALAAAALGLFGPGLLGTATTGDSGDPLRVEYYPFFRRQTPMTLRLHLGGKAVEAGEARVWISRSYLENVAVEHVTPQPERMEVSGGRLIYVFAVREPLSEALIVFNLKPQVIGRVRGKAGLENGETVGFAHIIYP